MYFPSVGVAFELSFAEDVVVVVVVSVVVVSVLLSLSAVLSDTDELLSVADELSVLLVSAVLALSPQAVRDTAAIITDRAAANIFFFINFTPF